MYPLSNVLNKLLVRSTNLLKVEIKPGIFMGSSMLAILALFHLSKTLD